jgi:hypothetical protein
LESRTPSLLEVALENSVVLPAFRKRDTISFAQARESCGNIQALLPANTLEWMITKLDSSIQQNSQFLDSIRNLYWPSWSIGQKFAELVQDRLSRETPKTSMDTHAQQNPKFAENNGSTALNRAWEATKRWRYEGVEVAIRDGTRKFGNDAGLRRGEIMNMIGREFGLHEPIDDISDIFPLARRAGREYECRIFFRWINRLYHSNQANALTIASNFPNYAFVDDVVIPSYVEPDIQSDPDASRAEIELSLPVGLEITANIPPVSILRSLNPNNLIAIRKEYGTDFLEAVRIWEAMPDGSKNIDSVKEAFSTYANELSNWSLRGYNGIERNCELQLQLHTQSTVSTRVVRQILNRAKSLGKRIGKLVTTPLAQFRRHGYITYTVKESIAENRVSSFKSTEVNFPDNE